MEQTFGKMTQVAIFWAINFWGQIRLFLGAQKGLNVCLLLVPESFLF